MAWTRAVIVAGDKPRRRPAAVRLPVFTTRRKSSRSCRRSDISCAALPPRKRCPGQRASRYDPFAPKAIEDIDEGLLGVLEGRKAEPPALAHAVQALHRAAEIEVGVPGR